MKEEVFCEKHEQEYTKNECIRITVFEQGCLKSCTLTFPCGCIINIKD
jgi:hypothetical protein